MPIFPARRAGDDAPHAESGAAGRHRGRTDALGGEDSTRETRRVNTCKSSPEVADHIRRKVIYEGLELEELGIDLADITDDVRLFDEDGLNLDSIDALEILAGVQREFGLSLPDADQAFIDEHCATVGRLASMVAGRVRGAGAPESATARTLGGATRDVRAGGRQSAPSAKS